MIQIASTTNHVIIVMLCAEIALELIWISWRKLYGSRLCVGSVALKKVGNMVLVVAQDEVRDNERSGWHQYFLTE